MASAMNSLAKAYDYQAADKKNCKGVISIEMSMGQMVEDVERTIKGIRPVLWYGKCGGDVPSPEEIVGEVKKAIKATE